MRASNKRGVTIIELLVTIGLFGAVMAATFGIMSLVQKSERKNSAHSEAYRRAAIVLRHVRQELRGADAQLRVSDGVKNDLSYVTPEWNQERVAVDYRGLPVWSRVRTLELRPDGALIRREVQADGTVDESLLCQLGEVGDLSFERTGPQLLRVTVRVTGQAGRGSLEEKAQDRAELTIGLAKQQFWQGLPVFNSFGP